jgi:uncharacterized protein
LLALATPAPIPPAPTEWVTDTAGLLQPQTVLDLNDRLRAYTNGTGHQVLVYIAPTTGGEPIEDWAVDAFAKWKVGRQGLDDGLVLFIFPRDHTVRIEVGYGLEAKVPDIAASRIVRDIVEPQLAAGHPDQGVTAGVDAILGLIGGETSSSGTSPPGGEGGGGAAPLSTTDIVALSILGILFLVFFIRSPWLAMMLLVNIFGGRGGGGGYGGAGFSGGGGRSGGGGASGSW